MYGTKTLTGLEPSSCPVSVTTESSLVQSGLAKEIIPDDESARLYTHELGGPFSPWSIIPRRAFDPFRSLRALRHVKSVLYEEFIDGRKRRGLRNVVFHRLNRTWHMPQSGDCLNTETA